MQITVAEEENKFLKREVQSWEWKLWKISDNKRDKIETIHGEKT